MLRMSKSELVFFDMFSEASKKAYECACMLDNLMNNFENVPEKVKSIENIEHECDTIVHKTMKVLNAAFITPIDREDIFLIVKEMDDIVDAIEAIAHRFIMYNVKKMTPEAIALVRIITESTKELNALMDELVRMKKSQNIHKSIIEINRLENVADDLYRMAITNLFTLEQDPIEVIKWKGIYEFLEKAIDACEDVANIIEGVVMKNV